MEKKEIYTSFLGRGWKFPPSFHRRGSQIAADMVEAEEDIRQSLQILLSTRRGERVKHPRFGCDLDSILFQPVSLTLTTQLQEDIRTAILLYEHRIDLHQVVVALADSNRGLINVSLDYTIRTTNSRENRVYPFYVEEGNVSPLPSKPV
jgi:hypothetical protein